MEELIDGRGREKDRPEVVHLVAGRFRIENHSYGVLHPGVGHQDPQGGQIGPDSYQPGGGQVQSLTHTVPAEEQHGDERTLQEEGHNAFHSQRSAENIAHKPGIGRPVSAELEFEDQPGGHAYGEIDPEEFEPEFGNGFPFFVARAVIDGGHDGDDPGQAKGQRDEYPMVEGRERELGARPVDKGEIDMFHMT